MAAADWTKRVAIDKTNARMVIIVAIASFITVFCLVASKTVFSQNKYDSRVTSAKQQAYNQLKQNTNNFNSLQSSYSKFESTQPDMINSNTDNATLVLDALPDHYDFPALITSINKVLNNDGFQASSIGGTDDQITEQTDSSSSSPQPVVIPFSFSVEGANYTSINQLVTSLQNSIRPIVVDTMNITGGGNNMSVAITAHTYFQPALNLTIGEKVVK